MNHDMKLIVTYRIDILAFKFNALIRLPKFNDNNRCLRKAFRKDFV